MTSHISARVAWHMDGWNGHICKDPGRNTYCIGCHSYPGELIRERRDLDWETANAGRNCADLYVVPACIFSINAFGKHKLRAFSDPPEWWPKGGAKRREWDVPPSTVCIWPYEAMYGEGVENKEAGRGKYNNETRLHNVNDYFDAITPDRSLIFYYANYSNPFSEDEQKQYVLVGISRVKQVGILEYYEERTQDVIQRYAGGYVWQRNVTSHYPDEGFCIPYHQYADNPEILAKILLVPENPRNFKYGTRAFTDDEALNLVERFTEVAGFLQAIGDTSENWPVRIAWLQTLIGELWQSRGIYPGMPAVLTCIGFTEAIPYWKAQVLAGKEAEARDALFDFLQSKSLHLAGLDLTDARKQQLRRAWKLKTPAQQRLLSDRFPRFGISADHINAILSDKRADNSITATLEEIAANPYLICEQYVGKGADDILPFYRIDHGIYPSPDLGVAWTSVTDDPHRLRAICVDQLKRETKHTFQPASAVIHAVNHRLSFLPEWKRTQFSEQYFEVDAATLEGALVFRETAGRKYVYLKSVFEAERAIETQMRRLTNLPDIALKIPVTAKHWHNYLYNPESELAQGSPDDYAQAIVGQADVCSRIFLRPVSILSGSAGTGKTTVIKAIIQAIEQAHGVGTTFCLLAPTGKATERIRAATGKKAATIHSFLAERGWLNNNGTLKPTGGRQEEDYRTYIIDEASMLDLELAYAVSAHKAQGSEFERVYFVIPKTKTSLLSREMFYTGITRASRHCTLLIEQDIAPVLSMYRPESSALIGINASLFEFRPIPDALLAKKRVVRRRQNPSHPGQCDGALKIRSHHRQHAP